MAGFDRVRRLDLDAVVRQVNQQTDLQLTVVGPAGSGQVGAGYVVDGAGTELVLTWQPGATAARHEQIAGLVEVARACGVAAPRYERVLQIGSDAVVLQQRLPGRPPDRAPTRLVAEMTEANSRLRGALAHRPELPAPPLYLTGSGPGFCLHEPLQEHDRRTRLMLDRIRRIGTDGPPTATGCDLVHLDFQPANVLIDSAGRLSGVVDWDGAARGDGDLDLVVLLFGLHAIPTSTATIADLTDRVRATIPADRLRRYWAHMSLRMIDWAIRHFGPMTSTTGWCSPKPGSQASNAAHLLTRRRHEPQQQNDPVCRRASGLRGL